MPANKKLINVTEQMVVEGSSSEERWTNFFINRWRQILLGIAIAFLLLLASFFFIKKEPKLSQTAVSEKQFHKMLSDSLSPDILLEQSQRLFSQSPSLKTRFQATLAQNLMAKGEWNHSVNYAEAALVDTGKIQPQLFTEFSQISLDIGQKKYKQALDRSIQLKEQLATQEAPSYSILAAYNLLRIALLQQEVGDAQSELNALSDYNRYIDSESLHGNQIALFNELKERDISFNDYITDRENRLRKELSVK
jgi:hypothetical protein